tara:strand:- start:10177 stop:10329 length:153 start_codon:yes stop_codon:yes gene_type:complete
MRNNDPQKTIWRLALTLLSIVVITAITVPLLIGGACTAAMVSASQLGEDN